MNIEVLIGGYGRRLGNEKAEIRLCGKKLIEIAIEKFSKYNLVFVCRDEEQVKKYKNIYDVDFICDIYKNFGALAGIHSALKYFENCIVTAVDMPFIKVPLVEHLYKEGLRLRCDALIPVHKYPEPLLAFYSSSSLEEIEKSIKRDERKIISPFKRLNTVFYPVEKLREFDKDLISFFNINTIEDLRRAEELCLKIGMEGL